MNSRLAGMCSKVCKTYILRNMDRTAMDEVHVKSGLALFFE